ncbi:MAG: hypothetical protein HN535_05830, partial [Flavobacteriales bacterium]|nr:hypothetical protein [Flavobacteriales bacterium]
MLIQTSTNAIANGSYSWTTSNILNAGLSPSIGDFYQGGVVFWIDPNDSTTGLVSDINDHGIHQWGCYSSSGATGVSIGSGVGNTYQMIAGCAVGSSGAALVCYNSTSQGYTDWFLPSKDELNQMYIMRNIINSVSTNHGGGSLDGDGHWSSTESNADFAWRHKFNNN